MLVDFMKTVDTDVIGTKYNTSGYNGVDNAKLMQINAEMRAHPVEVVGRKLRGYMADMKTIAVQQ